MAAMAGVRLLCVAAAPLAFLGGCSYDWTVDKEAPAVDAETDVMTQPDVGGIDASEAGGHDATVVVDSGTPGKDTGGAPPSEAGPDCAALTQQLLTARSAAIACTETVSACMTTVMDECGCAVVVGGDPATETAFASAVMAFTTAHCSITTPTMLCPGSCPTSGGAHVCLAADGGATYACYQ